MLKKRRNIKQIEYLEDKIRIHYGLDQAYGPYLYKHVDVLFPLNTYNKPPSLKEFKNNLSKWSVDVWSEEVDVPEINRTIVLFFEKVQESSWKFDECFCGYIFMKITDTEKEVEKIQFLDKISIKETEVIEGKTKITYELLKKYKNGKIKKRIQSKCIEPPYFNYRLEPDLNEFKERLINLSYPCIAIWRELVPLPNTKEVAVVYFKRIGNLDGFENELLSGIFISLKK